MLNGPDPPIGGGRVRGPLGYISAGQGLIEFVFGNRFRIGGIESGRLIEPEHGLGWGAGGTQERRPTGKIEVGEDGADGNGIGDEGDDTHGSPATTLRAVPRADEREDLIDARRAAHLDDVRRPGNEPATDSLPSCSEVDSSMPPCSRPNGDDLIPELWTHLRWVPREPAPLVSGGDECVAEE